MSAFMNEGTYTYFGTTYTMMYDIQIVFDRRCLEKKAEQQGFVEKNCDYYQNQAPLKGLSEETMPRRRPGFSLM